MNHRTLPTLFALVVSPSVAAAQLPYLELELSSSPPASGAPLEPTGPFSFVVGGTEEGWAATARTRNLTGGQVAGIWGRRSDAPGDLPGLLIEGSTGPPFAQRFFSSPCLSGGLLSYIATGGTSLQQGAFLEGTAIALRGDPIGATGETWLNFLGVYHFPDGRVWVRGSAAATAEVIVLEKPSDQVVLRKGMTIVGAPADLDSFLDFSPDPTGSHWAANAVFRVPGTGFVASIAVDGAIVDLGGGLLALEGEPLPPTIDSSPDVRWTFLRSPRINGAGDLTFVGTWGPPDDRFQSSAVIRNGVPVEFFDIQDPPLPLPIGMDAAGFVLATGIEPPPFNLLSPAARLDNVPIARSFQGVDVDGDGATDPAWSVPLQSATSTSLGISGSGSAYVATKLNGPGVDLYGVLRYTLAPERNVVCSGEPNSRGLGGRLRAIGSRDLAFNELRTTASGLPQFTTGIFLCSRTTGFAANPGGSQGNLCLGGAIGRFLTQAFSTGATGSATIQAFLNVLPQPSGATAAMAGETWNFQAWYRDLDFGGPTSNFSDAVAVTFR
ncbi:MAG: hypothetical protein AAGB93_04545 [Planctomycetota bacterium]